MSNSWGPQSVGSPALPEQRPPWWQTLRGGPFGAQPARVWTWGYSDQRAWLFQHTSTTMTCLGTMNAILALVRQNTLSRDDPQGWLPGAVLGWDAGRLLTANPRGGVLVLGPPGSGKTRSVIIPTVIVAPGACVSSSTKSDVMNETWRV